MGPSFGWDPSFNVAHVCRACPTDSRVRDRGRDRRFSRDRGSRLPVTGCARSDGDVLRELEEVSYHGRIVVAATEDGGAGGEPDSRAQLPVDHTVAAHGRCYGGTSFVIARQPG